MRGLRLTWQIYGLFVLLSAFVLCLFVLVALFQFRQFALTQTEARLLSAATDTAPRVSEMLKANDLIALRNRCLEVARTTGLRAAVMRNDGTVVFDTGNLTGLEENLRNSPELVTAFQGKVTHAKRLAWHWHNPEMFIAVPLKADGQVTGALRMSGTIGAAAFPWGVLRNHLLLATGAFVVCLALVAFLITSRLTRPLQLIKAGAERLSRGHLGARLPVPEARDLADVVTAMNRLAADLERRIQAALEQRNELEAVLTSMMEGVIAVDASARVININRAASNLFGVDAKHVTGQSIEIAIRHTELQQFVRRTLSTDRSVENEIIVYHEGQRYLQAHGTLLRDAEGRGIGGVIALNDVTRLRRLEHARRDFVANVSHELRTPITSIKGYAETLLDGAVENPHDAREFLSIVLRQSDRLNALIDDLLTLSRVEQEAEDGTIERQPADVCAIVEGALNLCIDQANAKNIPITFDRRTQARVLANGPLLQQAVVNLIENAIRYSEPEAPVEVRVVPAGPLVRIEVADHGCGIAPDHLPRLFERFYRADRARSRRQGGTGLGLAIVKHIVRVHGGQSLVESKLGQGSIFTIELPALAENAVLAESAGH